MSYEKLRAFFDLDAAGRWAFDRRDGVHCEGYAIAVEPARVLFGYGGPGSPADEEWIPFEVIAPDGLAYWDEKARRWVAF